MFTVISNIDTSEPVNPVLRVHVGQLIDGSTMGTRTYSMSLQSVSPDKHDWCQQVMSRNINDIVNQVEYETKKGIKRSVVNTLETMGIDINI